MPTEARFVTVPRVAVAAALMAGCAAHAQTDDPAPFYAGGTVGVTHVSNVFRQAATPNSDRVTTLGILAGADQRWGRQRFSVDAGLQQNKYGSNRDLDNQSYNIRSTLAWQTVGNLSGTVTANSSRALADFNIGSGVDPLFKKNVERNNEYQALARLGVLTRYSVEAGWTHRARLFSAAEYDRFVYSQNTKQVGVYATPGANVRLGVVARDTRGAYPRYPTGITLDPDTLQLRLLTERNDYSRKDLDFTTNWETGGSSTLSTRISRSRLSNSLNAVRDFSYTTGSLNWNWRPSAKFRLGIQYTRDTGQETQSRGADVNRVYTNWGLTGAYALTGKLNFTAAASRNRSHRVATTGITLPDAFDNDQTYAVGANWTVSRGVSLGCQYNHASRDSSVTQYIYSAHSLGCSSQILFY